MYQITPYTKRKAIKLNVIVKASKRKDKKLDVYDRKGNYLTSVGAKGYLDFPTYKKLFGKEIADIRRKMYKVRHANDRKVRMSPGWFADQLLW